MTLLRVEGLSKSYGNQRALTNISLQMKEGEILALLGPTGAGKTSTLLCIAGLIQQQAGTITIANEDVSYADPRQRDLAIVFEGFNLLPVLNVYDNIALPLRSPCYREEEHIVEKRVRKAAYELKIVSLLERRIDQLSGGELQRVAIARALLRDPKIYLLDEPLSALDLKLRESLRTELRNLQQEKLPSILYATHDYHGAASIADRIALIENGCILQVDTLDQLLANPVNMSVGKLIGSPAMCLFQCLISGMKVSIEGYDRPIKISEKLPEGPAYVGWWPEDIDISMRQTKNYQRAVIHATDFRGIDRTLQVRFSKNSFRKVVPLEFDLMENDNCWFNLPNKQAFYFDFNTGERIGAKSKALI